jgi:hypothetical protein
VKLFPKVSSPPPSFILNMYHNFGRDLKEISQLGLS